LLLKKTNFIADVSLVTSTSSSELTDCESKAQSLIAKNKARSYNTAE